VILHDRHGISVCGTSFNFSHSHSELLASAKKTTSSKVLLVLGVGAVMAMGGLFYLQMPVRDSNNLYQSNTPVATVHDPKLDKEKKTITFAEARTPTGMRLDVDSIFEYRYWKLRCSGQPQDAAASRLPQPLSYPNLVCHIEGYR
jgi:hypothetical protein